MSERKPLTDETGEVRELDEEDIRAMRPIREVVPELASVISKRRPGQRGPQKAVTKEHITLRIDRDVVEHFRASGDGWQTRLNDTLRRAVGL